MEKWKSYLEFFVSMLLYAFSGVAVIGLSSVFGGVGQLIARGFYAFLVVAILMVVTHKPLKFHKSHYNPWLYALDLICRPLSTLFFVYAVLYFANDANKALFYLFSFRVIASLVLDLILKEKTTKWIWIGFGLVLLGIVVFSFPWDFVLIGFVCAAASGVVEAIQRKVWGMLEIDKEDKLLIALTEFASWFVLAGILFVFTSPATNLAAFNFATFGYLTLATMIALGTTILDLTAFSKKEDTLEGNVIQSSEMGFAGVINYLWNGTAMFGNQIVGAIVMILALVAVGINELSKKKE